MTVTIGNNSKHLYYLLFSTQKKLVKNGYKIKKKLIKFS
jgi:hypothetical protein